MPISGKDLIELLKRDSWQFGGRRRHGILLYKHSPGEKSRRSTTVPDKAEDLPTGTLGAILSPRQTGLGNKGLQQLIKKHSKR